MRGTTGLQALLAPPRWRHNGKWRIAARGGRYAIARSPAGARCVVPRKDGSIAAAPALRAAIEPINWPCVPERGWMIGLPPKLADSFRPSSISLFRAHRA
ncbi:hypothetical protein L0Z13_21720 [Burkholderia multivorans]|uniref:hypothetical protein n=1 Tax=Burkholderia multivorans TaxID=87883 RepID=UPI001D01ED89|nr:hypothetical protein [Burkholderia multivorans]MCO1438189.1 hypothetical protein [Burkholderia multivorans]MDN7508752.1 hypothetical protein [Burkholderia multivorans]UQN57428.1 hypothetical protein L0Y94_09805 [Burkholderia multivorans]UQN64155.1 hypothetical protein L0Y92_05225 [Burkholderia multivorans]UQO09523.1 hypothetical protein L0Z13_21720 [Burkholderia multivorans]